MIRTFLVKDKEKFTKIRKVNLVREKNVRLEELVGERLIGSEEPLEDEVKAIKEEISCTQDEIFMNKVLEQPCFKSRSLNRVP